MRLEQVGLHRDSGVCQGKQEEREGHGAIFPQPFRYAKKAVPRLPSSPFMQCSTDHRRISTLLEGSTILQVDTSRDGSPQYQDTSVMRVAFRVYGYIASQFRLGTLNFQAAFVGGLAP